VINEYTGNKVSYTDKFMEDSYLSGQIVNMTPTKMIRAIDEDLETKILNLANVGQTINSPNTINGLPHRFSGGNAGQLEVNDFFAAKLILKKANVPLQSLIAIVPPEVAYIIETQLTTSTAVSYNPMWEGIIETGMTTGMRFIRNIGGFDVYESNYLPSGGASETAFAEADGSTTNDVSGGKVCQFFSAASPDVTPFMGAWLRPPKIESWRDGDKQADYYQMTTRYGLKMWRPESLISVVTTTSVL